MESVAATVDAAQFADWTRPALLAMTRLARRLAPDADPDDIVQESLARAWVKRGQFDPARGTPTTWLLAIVADQSRASRRARVRRLRVVDDRAELPDAAAPPAGFDPDPERALDPPAAPPRPAGLPPSFLGVPAGGAGAGACG